jgi:hypothetical protein
VKKIFISRKRWEALERRVTDLEREVQDQPEEIMKEIYQQWMSQMTKSNRPYRQDRNQCSEKFCAEKDFLLAAEQNLTKDERG